MDIKKTFAKKNAPTKKKLRNTENQLFQFFPIQ